MEQLAEIMFGFVVKDSLPLRERIAEGVRRHFDFIAQNPDLPLFMLNELRRNPESIRAVLQAKRGRVAELIAEMQAAIDANADAGVCCRMSALMLVIDIVSLNVFTFIGMPMIGTLIDEVAGDREEFLRAKREENVTAILKRIDP